MLIDCYIHICIDLYQRFSFLIFFNIIINNYNRTLIDFLNLLRNKFFAFLILNILMLTFLRLFYIVYISIEVLIRSSLNNSVYIPNLWYGYNFLSVLIVLVDIIWLISIDFNSIFYLSIQRSKSLLLFRHTTSFMFLKTET